MGAVWGRRFTLTIFGESHGPAIGGVLSGVPSGFKLDFDRLMVEMNRRRPGGTSLGTPRLESDCPEILSGLLNGITTGAPLAFIIRNSNTKSADYEHLKDIPRPGHADYTAAIRYKGHQDLRGGGHFSGRLTACLTFAGALARQILVEKGVHIGGRISRIGPITDQEIDYAELPAELFSSIAEGRSKVLPVLDSDAAVQMEQFIEALRERGDSVGGAVEVFATGIEAGLGDPFFDSIETHLSALTFSVPAVKAVEFGLGMAYSMEYGSHVNDCYALAGQTGAQPQTDFCDKVSNIKTLTNHAGGIVGGITNGMPVVMRVGFKPTPSISLPQKTLNRATGQMVNLEIQGRHDPCVVIRALPVVEACMAMVLLDELLVAEGYK